MKPKSNIYKLYVLLVIFILIVVIPAHSQEGNDTYRSKSVFLNVYRWNWFANYDQKNDLG